MNKYADSIFEASQMYEEMRREEPLNSWKAEIRRTFSEGENQLAKQHGIHIPEPLISTKKYCISNEV